MARSTVCSGLDLAIALAPAPKTPFGFYIVVSYSKNQCCPFSVRFYIKVNNKITDKNSCVNSLYFYTYCAAIQNLNTLATLGIYRTCVAPLSLCLHKLLLFFIKIANILNNEAVFVMRKIRVTYVY